MTSNYEPGMTVAWHNPEYEDMCGVERLIAVAWVDRDGGRVWSLNNDEGVAVLHESLILGEVPPIPNP